MDAELEKVETMIRQREAVHELKDMLENSGSTKHTTTFKQVK